jgi:energy-coupling factor transporter transmembrane protein EcfT
MNNPPRTSVVVGECVKVKSRFSFSAQSFCTNLAPSKKIWSFPMLLWCASTFQPFVLIFLYFLSSLVLLYNAPVKWIWEVADTGTCHCHVFVWLKYTTVWWKHGVQLSCKDHVALNSHPRLNRLRQFIATISSFSELFRVDVQVYLRQL